MTASTVVLRHEGKVYDISLDSSQTVTEARVYVSAHDKEETWRRVKHPATISRLQALIRPAPRCPHCGAAT